MDRILSDLRIRHQHPWERGASCTYTQSGIQVIGSHQQLQAQLGRNFHIRHVRLILVLLVVKEVFANFLENDATVEEFRVRRLDGDATSWMQKGPSKDVPQSLQITATTKRF